MTFDFKNKVVFITGGATGIGAGTVKEIADEAKFIAILDLDVASGTALEKELNTKYGNEKTKFFKADVTSDDLNNAYDAVLKQQGYIDVVINNAGIMNDFIYKKAIAVNVTAVAESSFRAYNFMRKDKGGKGGTIINIASIAGLYQLELLPVYSATKTAVIQFSITLGGEPHFSRSGVRIITICPGATKTSLISDAKLQSFDPIYDADLRNYANHVVPLQTVEQTVSGIMKAYKNGKSASVWLTSVGMNEDITPRVTKAFEILSENVGK